MAFEVRSGCSRNGPIETGRGSAAVVAVPALSLARVCVTSRPVNEDSRATSTVVGWRPGRARRATGSIGRLAAFGLIGALFVWLAAEFDPVQSSAHLRAGAGTAGVGAKPVRGKLLGSLVGAKYTIRIHASPRGALYGVWDTRSGRALAEDLWADEVYREFPDLDLRALHAAADEAGAEELIGPLMTAEPHGPELP